MRKEEQKVMKTTTRITMSVLNERQDAAVKGGREKEGKLWKKMELIGRGEYITRKKDICSASEMY